MVDFRAIWAKIIQNTFGKLAKSHVACFVVVVVSQVVYLLPVFLLKQFKIIHLNIYAYSST